MTSFCKAKTADAPSTIAAAGLDVFALTQEQLEQLSVADIKDLRIRIDNAMKENDENMLAAEANRNKALREIGNHLHESVPISNDEVSYLLLCSLTYPTSYHSKVSSSVILQVFVFLLF